MQAGSSVCRHISQSLRHKVQFAQEAPVPKKWLLGIFFFFLIFIYLSPGSHQEPFLVLRVYVWAGDVVLGLFDENAQCGPGLGTVLWC